jgi:tetratricopeptide (TPR) repeat protein
LVPRRRRLLIVVISLAAASALEAQVSPPELEEAAEVARRAATSTLRGQNRILFDTLDVNGILQSHVGADVWAHLTARQRELLRASVRQTFASALTPPRSTPGEVAWSSARGQPAGASVFLGLRFGDKRLKTRWELRRAASGGWRIEDVTLADPGVSLANRAILSLGPHPVRPRDRHRQARQEALPRLAGLAAIALLVSLIYRRLAPPKRVLLLLTASAPAVLFLVDGILAVRRALAEPYAISEELPSSPWDRWLRLAREAEREGQLAQADPLWDRANAAGAAVGPIAYERGLGALERGDLPAARRHFQNALDAPEPAPGGARELALIELSAGRNREAEELVARYLAATGPDPDALSLDAVIESNLGSAQRALAAIQEARELVGGGIRGAELEARVRARTSDAAGTVTALRTLESTGRLDREALRADPAYSAIATDPVWIGFLNETPSPGSTPRPTPTR